MSKLKSMFLRVGGPSCQLKCVLKRLSNEEKKSSKELREKKESKKQSRELHEAPKAAPSHDLSALSRDYELPRGRSTL